MAYNDDAVLARLSSLNESHDSIATAAQWIMFHRRHADRTVQLWLQRLKDSSSSKRLSLIYLANEVAQQSRIRHKDDFITAFSPVIAEATSIAYKGAPAELQGKLRRVIEVWKERSIFEAPIQNAIDSRLEELDKVRGPSKAAFGGSIFGGAATVPSDFAPLITAHQNTTKLVESTNKALSGAEQEYNKQTDPATEVPSAPVFAARLNGLLRTLSGAENAVAERIKSREALIVGLEQLLASHRELQQKDEASAAKLSNQKTEIEDKKQQVEIAIMRALGSSEGQGSASEPNRADNAQELDRPEMEALTPPAMEAFTPPEIEAFTPPPPENASSRALSTAAITEHTKATSDPAGNDAPFQAIALSANGSNKRRRVNDGDISNLGAEDGIDPDVAAMLEDRSGS